MDSFQKAFGKSHYEISKESHRRTNWGHLSQSTGVLKRFEPAFPEGKVRLTSQSTHDLASVSCKRESERDEVEKEEKGQWDVWVEHCQRTGNDCFLIINLK